MEETNIIDLTKERIEIIKPSISHQEFIDAYRSEVAIIGFIGAVKIDNKKLNSLVPVDFINSSKPIMIQERYKVPGIDKDGNEIEVDAYRMIPSLDKEGDVITEQKSWSEYSISQDSIDNNILLSIGARDSNGNRHSVLKDEELRQWINYFGVDKVLTKSEYHNQIKKEEIQEINV